MSVSPRLRFEVLKRDEFRCAYCGVTSEAKDLQIDHIVPRAGGGTDEITNLITACRACNQGKSDKPLTDVQPSVRAGVVTELEERVDRTIRYANAVALERQTKEQLISRVMVAWFRAWPDAGHEESESLVLDRGEFPENRSVAKFLEHLPVDRVLACVDATAAKFAWPYRDAVRYFAGCCWRLIKTNDIEHRYAELEDDYATLSGQYYELREKVQALTGELEDRDQRIARLLAHECEPPKPRYDVPTHVRDLLGVVK